ncbi:MAG: response regulator [Spirulinaceae cyanobacterium SM2_1_0]|nr:response regulator [Spirulinaceae cyanobacterium SM2_1_0]
MATQKILVIDDSRVIRNMVKDMLPAGNVEVVEAKNGEEGAKLIRSVHPNLIMLDFLLPKKSGWQVYQEIQADPRLSLIPLMLMSGRKEEVTEKISEPFEYFSFLEKPFEKKQLVGALKEAMQKAQVRKKQAPKVAAAAVADVPVADGNLAAEVQAMKQKMAQMQTEILGLKKQLSQLVAFIKQKMR